MEESGFALTADLSLLGVGPGTRLVDVGCGEGRHVVEAARRGAVAVGVDVAPAFRDGARRGWGDFALADGARLPFDPASFDAAVCTEVLEHVDDPVACIAELSRVLRPGGRLAVSVPTTMTEDLFWRFPGYARTPGGHVRVFRTGELARLLRRQGFRLYDLRYRHSLASLYWLLRCLRGLRQRRRDPLRLAVAPGGRRLPYQRSRFIAALEGVGDTFWPKSLVLYSEKVT
jgi:SAM-dependent methyltransferase